MLRRLNKGDKFELTKDHITLLTNAYVGWQDCETGAPEIDPKRPYGNSGVAADVCGLLGWKPDGDEDEDEEGYSEDQCDKALEIHYQTDTALQIILTTCSFKPGVYEKTEEYNDRAWKLVE